MKQQNKQQVYSRDRGRSYGQARGSFGGNDTVSLPSAVLVQYYKDKDKKVLDVDLLDEKAKERALSFKQLKPTQMRRFYDEIKAIERKIMAGKDIDECEKNFNRDRALIVMLKAKAVYAEKRGVSPREFTQFVFDHVGSVHDLKDFKGFVKAFEAVVAFHKFFAPER